MSVSDPSPEPPDLRLLRRVIPVVQTQEAVGWSITLIAVEAYDDGFILSFRLYGDGKPSNPDLMLRVSDDQGHTYRPWGGGGTGEPTRTACHWRLSFNCAPTLDLASRELGVVVDAVRAIEVEFAAATGSTEEPPEVRPVAEVEDAGPWVFAVPLV